MTTIRTPARVIPRAFPGIKPEEIQEIIANCRIRHYPADAVLCREDSVEETFYMILEGDFEVTKNVNYNEKRLLKNLTAGDFFGEMALIHNAPRAASVRSLTSAVVLELNKEGFNRVLKQSPSVAMAMVSEISSRLRTNDQLAVEDLRLRARELADAYQKLAEQDMARNEFLTTLAHELRTPLAIASGYLHNLQKGMFNGEQLPAAIETAARNVDRIVNLANDLLFLQEQELVLRDFQTINLSRVVERVVEKYQAKAAAREVALNFYERSKDIPAQGDETLLERAVVGLVDNAIKFTSAGGVVNVRLDETDEAVRIRVEDSGIGIAPHMQRRIFDRFYHLEKNGDDIFDGLGIGLSIARQVVQQHHGQLEVSSELGKGSEFTITLPK
ncbi:MAG: cyclic nucleotide-binding domain-containing protein [Anaerolineales bacterium]|nr:cyclic nucleotide-binding domain-containing protein [Anaerolineales bacterium]